MRRAAAIVSFGSAIAFAALAFPALAIPALAQDLIKEFWVPSRPSESPQKAKERSDAAAVALAEFKTLTFLQPSDVKSFKQNLQTLVGNYFFVENAGTPKAAIVLVGQGKALKKEIKTELKDDVVFRGIVQKQWNSGLTLPFLAVNLGSDEVAELTIQDVVTVVSERPLADEISCAFPKSWREDAKTQSFYYITGASVTAITSKRYKKNKGDGNGAFSIIKLGGDFFFSDEEFSKQNVIAISKVPAKSLDAADCKEPSTEVAKADTNDVGVRSVDQEVEAESVQPGLVAGDTRVRELIGGYLAVRTAEPRSE